MKKIKLGGNKNLYALVDDIDYLNLNQFKWSYHGMSSGYYATRIVQKNFVKERFSMSRQIMEIKNTDKELVVDHINGNRLDNRKINLRVCTLSENAKNRKPNKKSKTGIKGVFEVPRANGVTFYRSIISKNNKKYNLGVFSKLDEARVAYQNAAKELHGQFAKYR